MTVFPRVQGLGAPTGPTPANFPSGHHFRAPFRTPRRTELTPKTTPYPRGWVQGLKRPVALGGQGDPPEAEARPLHVPRVGLAVAVVRRQGVPHAGDAEGVGGRLPLSNEKYKCPPNKFVEPKRTHLEDCVRVRLFRTHTRSPRLCAGDLKYC